MDLSHFDYDLPEELIAQHPPAERDGARMLVLDRKAGVWHDRQFRDLPEFLTPDDLLVFNNSRVFKSRLIGHRLGHTGRIEIFLAEQLGDSWRALVRPGRKLPPGEIVEFAPGFRAVVEERLEHGERLVRLEAADVWQAIQDHGHIPLPPYIRRSDDGADTERYQTVFARERGSVAAPTAGLHFTPEILARCEAAGAKRAEVTLHVGLGTFQPLHAQTVEDNELHRERYAVSPAAAAQLAAARRVLAVGTTAVRTIESFERFGNAGQTNLFIYPGFSFQRVDAMLTNFHLPQSSLLLLVSAFAGQEFALAAYRHAVANRYRFFSYGDCMLIL
ncbi:MAG TPA: tRNA preQ1(34) S-adenosylmethionine ribosyltransferase-isomerase QueA [Bryobacteraceae bacterium]|nr:tRNA preQ1(34) S-adenosylmethionine ribosyltransferase-isomerase QueA [Bryobacteraceae bacterium]